MRLIDADALIEDIKTKLWDWDTVDGITSSIVLKQTITDINNAPTIDAVPVVRCKDCKWSIKDDWICGHPNNNAWNISVEHYCGYGERKDDE